MPYDLRKSPYRCLSCETRQQECRCCDVGNDYGFFDLTIAGCDGLAGRHTVTLRRYRDPETIATGVSYPASDPCGVFWGTISNGEGCSAGGTNWGGSIGFLNWCDGTDAAIPWHVEVFCYNADSSTWVSQGEATVTSFECSCRGAVLEFTLPTLDCCCDGGGEPITTCCCPDNPIPTTITATLTNVSGCPCLDGETFTLNWTSGETWSATKTVCGETVTLAFTCTSSEPCELIARLTVAGDATADVLAQLAPDCAAGTASGLFESISDLGGWATYCGSSTWSVEIDLSW